MERAELRKIAEALVLGSSEPISAARLAEILPGCKPADARDLVRELNGEYLQHGRSFEIVEVAGGYQVRTLPEFAPYLQQTLKTRPLRLSRRLHRPIAASPRASAGTDVTSRVRRRAAMPGSVPTRSVTTCTRG